MSTLASRSASPAARAAAPSPPVPAQVTVTPLFADSVSWNGFSRYWTGFVKNVDRVVLVVAIIAAAALFIITRGKWL